MSDVSIWKRLVQPWFDGWNQPAHSGNPKHGMWLSKNYIYIYIGVSKNNGTPKASILIGFSITIHFGVPLCLETPIYLFCEWHGPNYWKILYIYIGSKARVCVAWCAAMTQEVCIHNPGDRTLHLMNDCVILFCTKLMFKLMILHS